ncbi:MAG TPA: hypothetical protein VMW07_06700 [Gallionella sp.]|jgi:hypothetical protein|nr:hypothetical protein [Gallionella sp.]
MNNLFKQFESKFDELKELEQDELPRSLRLFNIRFRLAIDIDISFKGKMSLTKSKEVRDTYILVIQLMEIWNAYEAFMHFAVEVGTHVAKKASKSKIYSQAFLTTVGSMPVFFDTLSWLKSEFAKKNTFERDFELYVRRIEEDAHLSGPLKDDALSVLAYLKGEKTISGIELISLIYAERNMYYHNGETAKMGMTYQNRKLLIGKYRDTLVLHMLKLAIFVIDEQISNCK